MSNNTTQLKGTDKTLLVLGITRPLTLVHVTWGVPTGPGA